MSNETAHEILKNKMGDLKNLINIGFIPKNQKYWDEVWKKYAHESYERKYKTKR